MHPIRFRLLGSIEVESSAGPVRIGGPKERAVLALLLLNANRVVSHAALSDGLWSGSPPESGRHTVAVYVSRLRRRFDDAGIEAEIETHPHGYCLRCEPEEIDLQRFEHLARDGRAILVAGSPERATELFDEALALRRGEPLGDLADAPFVPREALWLEEQWLATVVDRIDAGLELGRETAFVGELESLVAEHPYREDLCARLMIALYRTGRQAEALEVYREGRRRLMDELGIEPGEELQQLQRAVLQHDPSLAAPARPPAAAPPDEPSPPGGRRRLSRARWVGVAALFVGLGVALALGLDTSGSARIAGPGLAALDLDTHAVVPFAVTREQPGDVEAGAGSIWVTQPRRGTVLRLDARHGRLLASVKIGGTVGGLAFEDGAVWAASTEAGSIVAIDAATTTVADVIRVGNGPTSLARGYGSVWVVNAHDRTLSRVDVHARRVVAEIATDATGPGIAVGAGGVWVTDEPTGRVVLVDPRSNTVTRVVEVGNGPTALAVDGQSVWVTNRIDGTLAVIDARSRTVTATVHVGDSPTDVAARSGTIWVANELSESVTELTSVTGGQRTTGFGGKPTGLDVNAKRIFVSLAQP